MIRGPVAAAAIATLLLGAAPAVAVEATPFAIGYLEIADDARYLPPAAYAGIEVRPRHRPVDGAELAISDSRIIGRALKLAFSLERADADTADGLARALDDLAAGKGVRFFLVDAARDVLEALAQHTHGRDILLFNVSEPANALRAESCAANLMNTLPSRAMLTDALVQYLVSRRWTDVLVLRGPAPDDLLLAASFAASTRKFGARVIETRDFVLGNDPRERGKNNLILLTQGVDYDVVFVTDSIGAVGRYLPYQTALPRPVVGSEGLIADTWHWTFERHGAPQLNQRFERKRERRMEGADWAAWIAVKAIVEAAARTRATDFASIASYLHGEALTLDGYKGTPVSFRPWNNQLRQPILLHTHNAVVARAPLEGFLHATQYMDTLGYDAPEERCRF